MRYLITTIVLAVTSLHTCSIKQLAHLQIAYQQKSLEPKSEKTGRNTPAVRHTKKASEATALTLEYFAVQLPR
jgi:hypothetical protein